MILHRANDWPMNRISTVMREWEGQTACVIGGGESLTQGQVDRTFGRCRVIAVNDAYRRAPWADVCYFADKRWWEWHRDRAEFIAFPGQKCTIVNSAGPDAVTPVVPDPEIYIMKNYNSTGLSAKPDGLHTGSNSGYQAINLAVLAGASRILLLGFDLYPGHWFGDHPIPTPVSEYEVWLHRFATMEQPIKALGIEVINCSPGSVLMKFKRGDIESVLSDPQPALLPA